MYRLKLIDGRALPVDTKFDVEIVAKTLLCVNNVSKETAVKDFNNDSFKEKLEGF